MKCLYGTNEMVKPMRNITMTNCDVSTIFTAICFIIVAITDRLPSVICVSDDVISGRDNTTTISRQQCQPIPYAILWHRLELDNIVSQRFSIVDPTGRPPVAATRGVRSRRRVRRSPVESANRWSGWVLHDNEADDDDDEGSQDEDQVLGMETTTVVSRSRRFQRQQYLRKLQQQHLRSLVKSYDVESRRQVARQTSNNNSIDSGRRRRRTPTPPWHCRLATRWKRMPDDVFPPFIETGVCVGGSPADRRRRRRRRRGGRRTDRSAPSNVPTCMGGLFECVPRRYTIKILRRLAATNNDSCLPVPVTGVNETYLEDAWVTADYQVIVSCDCSKRRRFGHYNTANLASSNKSNKKIASEQDNKN